ncbi:hypothetical protein BLA29_003069 [Euroglyphus maynei]|uniref:Uncharacterized protein n=1 Tax=Euroglyphus maynei TaxID=6958 RepID=A0A1Y3BP26_EURMA|nr:hypothetical protein BLA29_003069 [Euroglyphus maynei]
MLFVFVVLKVLLLRYHHSILRPLQPTFHQHRHWLAMLSFGNQVQMLYFLIGSYIKFFEKLILHPVSLAFCPHHQKHSKHSVRM